MSMTESPRKRLDPGRHLIDHYAKTEEARPSVQFLAPSLLRRYVSRGPDRGARPGQAQVAGHVRFTGCLDILGQSEIKELGLPFGSDEDVCRLDIAMDDTLGVRHPQRIGDLAGEVQQQLRLQRFP